MTDLRKSPPSQEQMEEYWHRARQCKSADELLANDGPLSFLFKDTIEKMLKEEMNEHLGYKTRDIKNKKKRTLITAIIPENSKANRGKWNSGFPGIGKENSPPRYYPKTKPRPPS